MPTQQKILHVIIISLINAKYYCGMMVGIHSVGAGVGECQSEESFVCFSAKPTQRACAWDFLWDRKKTRKGKVPEQWTDRI